jgi:hypothetical protein
MTHLNERLIFPFGMKIEAETKPGVLIAAQLWSSARGPGKEKVGPRARLKYLRLRFGLIPRIAGSPRGLEGLIVGIRWRLQDDLRRLKRTSSRADVLHFENKEVAAMGKTWRGWRSGNVQHGWCANLP